MFEAAPTLGPMTLSVFVGAALGWLALIAARLYAAQLQATLQPLECAEETEKLIAIPDGSSFFATFIKLLSKALSKKEHKDRKGNKE